MQNLTELLVDTDERKADQIEAILAGLDELDAYTGRRPHQGRRTIQLKWPGIRSRRVQRR